jgi:hypothetical protein
MLTIEKRNALCQKYNINTNDIKYTTYLITDENNFVDIIGVDLEIIPLKINIRCHMSKSITFNYKRCLKMVWCILDQYNN